MIFASVGAFLNAETVASHHSDNSRYVRRVGKEDAKRQQD